jgi:DNA polymerase-3 subunit delta'
MGRIPHAQLFVGPEGSGTLAMAIAYAWYFMWQSEWRKLWC